MVTIVFQYAAHLQYGRIIQAGEGFIHLTAEPERVAWVANAFYREVPDLLVLSVDETRLAAPVRFERTPDGVFPHLYGPLERRAIVAIQPMPRNQTGDYEFPGA